MEKKISNLDNQSLKKGESVSVVTVQKGKQFLDYIVSTDGLSVGSIVMVPLKNKIVTGIIWSKSFNKKSLYLKKEIQKVLPFPPLSEEIRNFILKISQYYVLSINTAFRLVINPNLKLEIEEKNFYYELGKLEVTKITPARNRVIQLMIENQGNQLSSSEIILKTGVSKSVLEGLEKLEILKKSILSPKENSNVKINFNKNLTNNQKLISYYLIEKVKSENYSTVLLKGVTGSGKTEIYLEAIYEAIHLNKQVLVLFPEISLSSNFYKILKTRIEGGFAEWHSGIRKKAKRIILKNILNGSLKLVFGARSAVFLPFNNLGLVIVDEEHDTSYKQEEGIHYNARDMAVLKGYYSNATVILVSATPSVETWANVENLKYSYKSIEERYGNAKLPEIKIVNLREEKIPTNRWISNSIIKKIRDCINKGQQSLLFINRRGYAPTLLCKSCYKSVKCKTCDFNLNEHKHFKSLLCHICGKKYDYPKICEFCGQKTQFISVGPGVERIGEEISTFFPNANVQIISSDHFKNIDELQKIFDKIISGEIEIIIGTQIISKGHNFPFLSFVGILDIDIALQGGDLRAAERTFQLLRQVVGRSGRFNISGNAIIQTYFPDNQVINALCKENDEDFLNLQSQLRKIANVPPYSRMVALIISSENYSKAKNFAKQLAKDLLFLNNKNLEIYGPADAKISRIRDKYRIRILIKAQKNFDIQTLLNDVITQRKCPFNLDLTIDVDPFNFN